MGDTTEVKIRPAGREDCAGIVALIKELAVFEKMPDEAKLTPEDLQRDGFDAANPLFKCLVADQGGKIIGMALYYFIYSTWKGKCLYLEDFFVTESQRNKEIGSRLFQAIAQIAVEEDCNRLDFEVLEWNPARRFYDRKGADNVTISENWHKHRINRQTIEDIATGRK